MTPTGHRPTWTPRTTATGSAMEGAGQAAEFNRQLNATQEAATHVMRSTARVCGPEQPVISNPGSNTGHRVCFPGDPAYRK